MTDERREITKRVMKAMRHPLARRPLAGAGADSAQHIIVCLRSDTIDYAAQRVRAAGGIATVVVPHGTGLVPLSWEMTGTREIPLSVQSEGPIHPDSELGMLMDYFAARGGDRLDFCIGEAQIVGRDPISVPA